MQFQGIQPQRRRLADDVYDQIFSAIVRREIGPEDTLIQEKLAEAMQISRTPVREALMRLEHEGVLDVSKRGSFRLRRISAQEIEALYQARAAIEGQSVRILAARRDPFDIAALRDVIAREEAIEAPTPLSYFEAHRMIHRAFVERAANGFLLEMFDMLWGKAMAFQLFASAEQPDMARALGGHLALVEIIAANDAEAAQEAIQTHVEEGFARQMDALAIG